MFQLKNKTVRHSPPDMTRTFAHLAVYMEKERVNEFIAGQKSNCIIGNAITEGMTIMFGLNSDLDYSELETDDVDVAEAGEEDLEVEITDEFD